MSKIKETKLEIYNDRLISLREVANVLSISTRAVYRLMSSGALPPPVKVGGSSRLYAADLKCYLKKLHKDREAFSRRIR